MNSRILRPLTASTAALLLALSLAACGGDSDDDSDSDDGDSSGVTVISEDDLDGALLTADDLPEGYTESADDDEDDSETGTCLDDIANLDDTPGFEADNTAKSEFELAGDAGQSTVSFTLDSYDDQGAVDDAIALFLETAQGCTTAQGTDPNGVEYDLTLETSDEVTLDGADSQVSVSISGSLAAQGQTFPAAFEFIVANQANNLTAVGTTEVGTSDGIAAMTEDLAQAQFDQLADIS